MVDKFMINRKNMHIYPWYISEISSTKDIGRITGGLVLKKSVTYLDGEFFHFGFDTPSINRLGKYFLDKILKDKKFYRKVVENIYRHSEKLLDFSRRIGRIDLAKATDRKLSDIYAEYVERLNALRVWGWIPVFLDGTEINYLSERISRQLKKELDRGDARFGETYSTLTSSEKMSEVQQEELARLRMLIKLQSRIGWKKLEKDIIGMDEGRIAKNSTAKKLFDNHLKKFGWLTYAYSGPRMTMKQLLANLADDIIRGDVKGQVGRIPRHYSQVKKGKKEIIKSLKISKELQYLSEVSSEFMFIKDYRKGIYQKSYVAMDPVLEEIGKRLGLTLKEMKYLVIGEVVEALQDSGAIDCKKLVAERMEKCCMITEKGIMKIYSGAECERELSKLGLDRNEAEKNSEAVMIKGMIAYQGKAKGKAKIILVESDVKKMEQGDILVSSATNPDLILAMKKAAAIITDTGGIISHAAIVSRELKIPCIVSTRIATQVLHDGDMVEVDADKGEVRIISRNK